MINADHLTFRLKTPWSDGTTRSVFSPLELIEKLAELVPPPRLNLVRYHGILAPHARDRSQGVPAPPSPTVSSTPGGSPAPAFRPHRLTWAALLARVFALDVTVCPACGGRLRLIAALTDPVSVRRYLQGVDLPTEPPPLLPHRASPQQAWDFAALLNTQRYIARRPCSSDGVAPRSPPTPAPLNLKHPFSSIGPVEPKRGAA